MKYTIIIQWSEEDKCYVVLLPDFTNIMQPCTHGETYEEALKNGREVLEMLIESCLADGEILPEPQVLGKSLFESGLIFTLINFGWVAREE